MNIIIDTDPGQDDAMAMMLAIKSGTFNVLAVTTVAGNSTIENTTRNARFILGLIGSDKPVYSGSSGPLERNLIQAVVHGKSGLEGLDPTNDPELTGDAVDRILALVKSGDVTIVALGPLTNIASCIARDPETMRKVKEIYIMGGAIRCPGNKNRVAEFNFFVDPEAADIVFRFPVRKTLIPLDACNEIIMDLADFMKIKNMPLRDAVVSMITPYIKNIESEEGVSGALMYDPLTVYALMKPDACRKRDYDIRIETRGDLTRGMSVAELRKDRSVPNVTVVESIDGARFVKDFVDVLSKP